MNITFFSNVTSEKKALDHIPHIAGIASLTVEKIFNSIYNNICRLISGDDLMNRVN